MSHRSCLTTVLVDNCTVERTKLRRLLQEDSRYTYQISEFNGAKEAMQWCQQEIPDVILLDFFLPDDNGLEFLQELRETLNNTQSAVIMLTEQGDETIAVRAMKSGAQDYLVKDKLTPEVLYSAINYAVERIQLIRQLEQSREQQQLIAAIALRIRQSLNLAEILRVTAKEVREFLMTDRVLVYQFQPDMSGDIVAESVVPGWTVALGRQIQDTCFQQQQAVTEYCQGKKRAIDDIYQAGLTDCHLELLEQFEVKAKLVVPILVSNQLWGLLIAHQCSASRHWQAVELDLLNQLAVQIAIAIQQASAYEHLQAELLERQLAQQALQQLNHQLEARVEQRTAALKESEERWHLAVRGSNDGIWDWNIKTDEVFISARWQEMRGFTEHDRNYSVEQWSNQIHPDDRDRVLTAVADHLAHKSSFFYEEYRFKCKDGSYIWVLDRGQALWDETGTAIRIAGSGTDISKRKQIEQALQESERRYATLAEASPVAIFRFDSAGNCVYVNNRWSEMTGRPITAALGMGWVDVLHPEDRDRLVKAWSQASTQKILYQNEGRCLRPDGSIIWFYIQSVPETDFNNNIIGYICTITDITSRKLVEEELIRQQKLLEVIFNESTDALFLVDCQTLLTLDCNQRTLELFEVDDKAELIGIEGHLLQRHPFSAEELATIVAQMQSKGFWSQEIEYVTRKGNYFWGNIAAKPITVAERNLNLVRVTDISDRKQAEEVLAIYTRELADLYNNAPCGYHSLDSEGRFININHTELQLLGYTYEEMIGKHFIEFITEASHAIFEQNYSEFKKRGWLKDLEFDMICQDGTILPVLLNATAVKSADGTYLFSRSTIFDIRDRKQAQQKLEQTNEQLARATRLKDEFLANMSHELRTPLNAILGMSEGFLEGVFGYLNQRQAKAIATIERSGQHLLELINDILDLSKIESGKMDLQLSEVSITNLCDASLAFIKQMALKKKISLSTRIAKNIGYIQVDDRRLRQMLINLLSNAVKFTPNGGSVILEVKLETAESSPENTYSKIETPAPNPKELADVCFSVIDTGIGIARENIGKLFQPFIQLDSSLNRQYSGTGLGLALVERIASLHGGTVSVNSEVGKGSCFTVRIPYKQGINSPITQVIAPLPSCRLPGANSPVFVIEDSVPAAEQITRYLDEMDMQPIVYYQGEGVIDEVLRVQPIMIFLDIQLPNLSGWDLLDQLKANPKTKKIPVIIISVLDERTQGIVNGAGEYLVKPFTRAQFQATLEKVQNATYAGISPLMQTPLILLVEDNQANIDTMSGYLESRGYRLISAQNGQQAIDFAKSYLPDLIVMDIQMPVMDGLEAMRRIRELPQFLHLPIIALTALAMSGDRELCLAAGANEYLTKPVKLKQLAIAIQRLLANSKK